MTRAITNILGIVTMMVSLSNAYGDLEHLRRQLTSKNQVQIRAALDQIKAGEGDQSLFEELQMVLLLCFRQNYQALAREVVATSQALALREGYDGAIGLLELLQVDYAVARSREAFWGHPDSARVMANILKDEFAEPKRLEALVKASRGLEQHDLPSVVALLRKAFETRTGNQDERNDLIQRAAGRLNKLISDGHHRSLLNALVPDLLNILKDDEWLPSDGTPAFSDTFTPLYVTASVAARLAKNRNAELTGRVQEIYRRIRQCNLGAQQNDDWLRIVSAVTGGKASPPQPNDNRAWKKVDGIINDYSGELAEAYLAMLTINVSTAARNLLQVEDHDQVALLRRIYTLKGPGVTFRDALFTYIRSSKMTSLIQILDRCAFQIGGATPDETIDND